MARTFVGGQFAVDNIPQPSGIISTTTYLATLKVDASLIAYIGYCISAFSIPTKCSPDRNPSAKLLWNILVDKHALKWKLTTMSRRTKAKVAFVSKLCYRKRMKWVDILGLAYKLSANVTHVSWLSRRRLAQYRRLSNVNFIYYSAFGPTIQA